MSQKSDDEISGVAAVIGIVCMIALVIAVVVYAIILFAALLGTVLAIAAWNEPVTIGDESLEPEEARAFIFRGLAGAVLAPTFTVFFQLLFGSTVEEQYWIHIVLAGYAFAALAPLLSDQQEQQVTVMPPSSLPRSQPVQAAPEQPAQPFQYASWHDEDVA